MSDTACDLVPGVRRAFEIVGSRWTLLIVAVLLDDVARFGTLRRRLPGISANVLTARLAHLVNAGLVDRRALPLPAELWVYGLTDAGLALRPAIAELCQWAYEQ